AKFIVACDMCEIRIETQSLKHARVHPERNGRIALLDSAESLSSDPCSLRDRFGGIGAAQAGLSQPLAQAGKLAPEAGQQGRDRTWHMGNTLPFIPPSCPIYDPIDVQERTRLHQLAA